ncbi:MAG: FHA domain-containing serine/threonine-protein kinase, partial [Planctomycetota bacterium]|nr:FHA domain-containing serine/threonine-protein kinase [Planctomycetota bacterium]
MSAPPDSALFLTLLDGSGEPDAALPPAELPRKGKLIVGSSTERADFVVKGQGIADVHCAIGRLKSGGWALKDLGSDFGTLLNGERIETARLEPGDELLIGSRKLRIVADAGDDRSAEDPADAQPKTPPRAAPAQRPASPASAAVVIAGYRIEAELGRGAMGRVLRATQTSLDRKVAVKVLAPKLANDATFVDRFREEARAAAQLNHPNVVTVYDVGEEGGQHFLSMEYMDGGSVEAHLSTKGRFHWREALGILRDAAAGLVYAESRGIVHRDIKPDNLMRNADGATKIADLGLAVQVEQAHVDGERGKVFGTPHFLAPELARGSTPDARSDLYSLGATAYRMISGRTPHEGTDPRSILRSVLNDEPPRLGELVQGLPGEVDELVHGMLAKDPTARTASAGLVMRQIDGILSGEPAVQGSGSKGRLVTAAGLIIVLVGAYAVLGREEPEDPTRPSPTEARDVTASAEPEEPPTPPSTEASDVAPAPGPAEAPVVASPKPAAGGDEEAAVED